MIHGAFLGTQGTLEVTWSYVEREVRQWLRLEWQECDTLARLDPPASKGFGMELIERILPCELEAGARVSRAAPGARVEIDIPAGQRAVSWSPAEMPAP